MTAKPVVVETRLSPPSGLAPAVRAWWGQMVEEWTFSPDGLELLRVACEARQRMLDADVVLKREGMIVRTPRGVIRANPAAKIRRAAEITFLQALRQLGLEP